MKTLTKEKIKTFTYIFTPIVVLNLLFIFSVYYSSTQEEEAFVLAREESKVEGLRGYINDVIGGVVQDVLISNTHEDFISYVNEGGEESLSAVEKEFSDFLKIKSFYDQARFIDKEGEEVIRVNNNESGPTIVSRENLQNKKDRYYFADTMKLDKGKIFISPFDLNVENGVVEEPIKPMIRVATPVFDNKGDKRGIVVLNYLGEGLLKNLDDRYFNNAYDVSILNKDGYFIKSSRYPEYEWAFMYEDKKDLSFSKMFPDVWLKIQEIGDGYYKTEEGIYIFNRICPQDSDLLSGQADEGNYYLEAVSFLSKKYLTKGSVNLIKDICIVSILLLIIVGIVVWLLIGERAKKNIAEKRVIQLNDILKIINKILRHDLLNKIVGIREAIHAFIKRGDKSYLDLVENSIESGIDLVNEMRELESMIETGKPLREYDLAEVVNEAKKSHSIPIKVLGGGKVLVDGAIISVFENLIRNAISHGKTKKMEVDIKLKNKKFYQIDVIDFGLGIPENLKEKVFEEGFKSAESSGSGLGLYIVKNIIKRYGGRIYIKDNKPKGTIFVIELPVINK